MRALPSQVFLWVAVLLSTCQRIPSENDIAADGGSMTVASSRAASVIGPEGGTIRVTQGPARGAAVVIPKGALLKPAMITIHAGEPATDLPSGTKSAGPVVVFGPEGQTFAKPVTVTIPMTRPAVGIYTRPHG